jgi:hypothetical protein
VEAIRAGVAALLVELRRGLVREASHISLATHRAHAAHVVEAIDAVVSAARTQAATAMR